MISLSQLIARLGPAVTGSVVPDRVSEVIVGGSVIYDGTPLAQVAPGDLVVGIGVTDVKQAITALASRGAACLLLRRSGEPITPDLRDAARSGPIGLLAVPEDASWMQLLRLLNELIGDPAGAGEGAGQEALTGPDDLFSLANAIAGLIDAPVTIEDPASRVLAFSERQEGADAARINTILGRRGPDEYLTRMRDRGVFTRIRSATRPVFVSGRPPDVLPRVVVPVRSGGEYLGSIWAVVSQPLPPERETALADAARMAALHVLRHRLLVDSRRTTERETVARILDGGQGAHEAARRRHLDGRAYLVLAAVPATAAGPDHEVLVQRLWDGLRLQLSSTQRPHAVGALSGTVYAIIALSDRADGPAVPPAVRQMLGRIAAELATALRHPVRLAAGTVVDSVLGAPRSRQAADHVLAVLRRRDATGAATAQETGAQILLDIVLDTCAEHPEIGGSGLARLRDYDQRNGTLLAETAELWLDHFGNTERVAASLGVHANTVRYRIRQVAKLVDLDDPQERLALTLHFRLRSAGRDAQLAGTGLLRWTAAGSSPR